MVTAMPFLTSDTQLTAISVFPFQDSQQVNPLISPTQPHRPTKLLSLYFLFQVLF